MSTDKPRSLLRLEYANAAEAYLRSLFERARLKALRRARAAWTRGRAD
jgi:hypothetical protein